MRFSFSCEEYICQQNESINDLKKNTGQICLHFTDSSLIFDSLISVKTLSNFVESIMFPPSLLGFNCQTDSRQKQPALDSQTRNTFSRNTRITFSRNIYPVTTVTQILLADIDFAGPQIPGFYVYCASFICMLPIKLVSLCLCILNYHNLYEAG